MIALKNEVWLLSLAPQRGASVLSCEFMGFPVFEPARPAFTDKQDVFASSCFPLIPFSNRIEKGLFSFNNETYEIRPNHPDQKFPIHGNSWEKPWKVINQNSSSCHLSLTYEPEAGGWPWAYRAEQVIRLEGKNLTFELSVENTDSHPFPVGIGLHPFFSNARSAQIEFEAHSIWEHDEDLIPTTSKRVTSNTGFSTLQPIAGRRLDNCFSGWDGVARIIWPEFDYSIEMQADPIFSNLVVYIQPENPFFCVEPVSHINNAFKQSGASSVDILKPRKCLLGKVTFNGMRL